MPDQQARSNPFFLDGDEPWTRPETRKEICGALVLLCVRMHVGSWPDHGYGGKGEMAYAFDVGHAWGK